MAGFYTALISTSPTIQWPGLSPPCTRTTLRDTRRSRAIALIAFPLACSRRIRTTVSTTNIPISPPGKPGSPLHHQNEGSLLDADHPANGVPFARRSTADPSNVTSGKRASRETTLADWFDGPQGIVLDEEVIGIGAYGFTLTVFSSEELPEDPYEAEDDEAELIESYQPKFAYGR